MNEQNFLHTKLAQYFDLDIPDSVKRNRHMHQFRGTLTELQANQILKSFDQSVKTSPASLRLGVIAKWLVPIAKSFCSGKDEMTKAVIIDFVNFAVLPLDLALYSCDV